jgi:hypothetical protein
MRPGSGPAATGVTRLRHVARWALGDAVVCTSVPLLDPGVNARGEKIPCTRVGGYSAEVPLTTRLTSGALISLAGLHVAWGLGSAFPFSDRSQLADSVVGTKEVPSPLACFTVAAALAAGGALVQGVPRVPSPLRRCGLLAMAGVFGVRGTFGFFGKTDLMAPGSTSPRFRHLDRRVYAPLCIGLALGALTALPVQSE